MSLLRSEVIKIIATRRTLIVLSLAVLAIISVGTASVVDPGDDGFADKDAVLRDVLTGPAGSAVLFALIVGILVSTWEYQHGTITHTFLVTPRRERVMAVKAVVGALCGLTLAGAAVAVSLAIALPWLGTGMSSDRWELVGRLVASAVLWGAFGVAIGALVASQVAAIVATFVWFLIVEPIIGAVSALEDVAPYLPLRTVQALQGSGDDESLLSGTAGLALTLAYVTAFTLLGLAATLRRDVT